MPEALLNTPQDRHFLPIRPALFGMRLVLDCFPSKREVRPHGLQEGFSLCFTNPESVDFHRAPPFLAAVQAARQASFQYPTFPTGGG